MTQKIRDICGRTVACLFGGKTHMTKFQLSILSTLDFMFTLDVYKKTLQNIYVFRFHVSILRIFVMLHGEGTTPTENYYEIGFATSDLAPRPFTITVRTPSVNHTGWGKYACVAKPKTFAVHISLLIYCLLFLFFFEKYHHSNFGINHEWKKMLNTKRHESKPHIKKLQEKQSEVHPPD